MWTAGDDRFFRVRSINFPMVDRAIFANTILIVAVSGCCSCLFLVLIISDYKCSIGEQFQRTVVIVRLLLLIDGEYLLLLLKRLVFYMGDAAKVMLWEWWGVVRRGSDCLRTGNMPLYTTGLTIVVLEFVCDVLVAPQSVSVWFWYVDGVFSRLKLGQ